MLKIGDVLLETYEIMAEIGRGGFSKVYLARNKRVFRNYAIKEYMHKEHSSSDVRNIIEEEVFLLSTIYHPGIPVIYDYLKSYDSDIIIMDYIEGRTLQSLLDEEGSFSQEKAVRWAIKIADTLKYLHNKCIIYRDVKPANIMITPSDDIFLIDFGTAKKYIPNASEDVVNLGTIGYAAPEQFGGMGQSDARTDIYGLGVTLFYMVTGVAPFSERANYPLYSIQQYNKSLSSSLEHIIKKCTNLNPADRYQSMDELLEALNGINKRSHSSQEISATQQVLRYIKFIIPLIICFVISMLSFLHAEYTIMTLSVIGGVVSILSEIIIQFAFRSRK